MTFDNTINDLQIKTSNNLLIKKSDQKTNRIIKITKKLL